jgi:hypothetical protein
MRRRMAALCLVAALCAILVQCTFAATNLAETTSQASKTDFNHDIRPILTENCFKCHGPDDGARKAGLRFDLRSETLKPTRSGGTPIVPGAPEKSELIARVTATDPKKHMPPAESGKKLSPAQTETLRRWILEGAPYATHWAYVKPTRPPLPGVKDKSWPRNPIDYFILARLEREGLKPSAPADKLTLARRVALDLTGLPPTPEQADAFVADSSPRAYEDLVDRLLQQDSFGEHWARLWLDLARYADSAGYADDPARTIWAFRDYVIKAFNANKPFDRFTLEQIAGDLFPDADEDDQVATAFHRNTMTNNEGGTDDEEFRNAAVVDRVNTTMAVWMGTSMACAQCHNHKYDPFSQEEYFRLFAIFNNTEDADRADEAPVLKLFSAKQKEQRGKLETEQSAVRKKLETSTPELASAQFRWEQDFPLELLWQQAFRRVQQPLIEDERVYQYTAVPSATLNILALPAEKRSDDQQTSLTKFYRENIAPELEPDRNRLAEIKRELAAIKPNTVPVMHELAGEKRRKTHIQFRGNFLALGAEVTEGVPAAFHPLGKDAAPNRLALAHWLIDEENPLTARVTANRFWEQMFGIGLVRTTEDFGSQGDLPSHPELLDWLATELTASKWDLKAFLKLLVTSATYCQSSRATPEILERDPENLLLARGPRFRMAAEVVRDQALCVSGLLSRKMFGPSVRPPRPSLGLTAAFGSSLDEKPSEGEDRYRRSLYIEWRRTAPYPSLVTFDAPNREVCTLRRPRSNTPLQALVTLNDPVYVEAAQALARRMIQADGPPEAKARRGFRLCLTREPRESELTPLVSLYGAARKDFADDPEQAKKFAAPPAGSAPAGTDAIELASWTTVANVLLNLDETLMKP